MKDPIENILSFDPIAEAELITGEPRSKETEAIGFLLHAVHGENKRNRLIELDDTTLSNDLSRYQRIIGEIGFEQVLTIPFASRWDINEQFFVYAHREYGILLSFDTYAGKHVNGGRYCYCIRFKEGYERGVTSSGGFNELENGELYWSGSHDCREAIRHHIRKLADNGTFFPKWPKGHRMFLWLLHNGDTKKDGYDYKAINHERIAMMPDWVREIINLDGGSNDSL